MKRFITGVTLSVLGTIGTIIMISIASLNPVIVNGRKGLLVSLNANEILLAFAYFGLMSIAGIGVCIYEAYFKEKI